MLPLCRSPRHGGNTGAMPKTKTTPKVADQPAPQGAGELRVLKRAARRREDADRAYAEALQAALDAGLTYSQIAKQLGVSRQAVRQHHLRQQP